MPVFEPADNTASNKTVSVRSVAAGLVVVFALAVLVWLAVSYLPFLADDALISFRYAARLVDGHGLTWTDGPPVEGYSNLSWILLLALLDACGIDLVLASRILGMAAMLATLAAIGWYYIRRRRADPVSVAAGLFCLAFAGPVAIWAIGGMEQPLQVLLIALGLVLSFRILDDPENRLRGAVWASLPLGLLAITRPDGFLFTGTISFGLLLLLGLKKDAWKVVGRLAFVPVLCVVGQEIFRLVYYGVWLPNPAYVKISGSEKHIILGLQYLRDGFFYTWPMTILTMLGGVFVVRRWRTLPKAGRGRFLLVLISLTAWCGYIAYVGGDIFPARRHFLPVLILMAFIVIESLSYAWEQFRSMIWRVVLAVFVVAVLFGQNYARWQDPENRRAVQERWEWDGQVLGLMLKEGFADRRPLLACTAAGCLPYWSELPCVDMLGLNDYHIARVHPPSFGQGRLAHELGDGRYVLDRRPDLVSFCGPSGRLAPCFRSGIEMVQTPEFNREYTPVRFEGRHPYRFQGVFWVRRFSEKIGITQNDTLVHIPAYLINGHSGTAAYLDSAHQFVVNAAPDNPGVVLKLPVVSGTWTVNVPDAARYGAISLHTIVRASYDETILADGDLPLTFTQPSDGDLDIMIRPDYPVELHALELRRTP